MSSSGDSKSLSKFLHFLVNWFSKRILKKFQDDILSCAFWGNTHSHIYVELKCFKPYTSHTQIKKSISTEGISRCLPGVPLSCQHHGIWFVLFAFPPTFFFVGFTLVESYGMCLASLLSNTFLRFIHNLTSSHNFHFHCFIVSCYVYIPLLIHSTFCMHPSFCYTNSATVSILEYLF